MAVEAGAGRGGRDGPSKAYYMYCVWRVRRGEGDSDQPSGPSEGFLPPPLPPGGGNVRSETLAKGILEHREEGGRPPLYSTYVR